MPQDDDPTDAWLLAATTDARADLAHALRRAWRAHGNHEIDAAAYAEHVLSGLMLRCAPDPPPAPGTDLAAALRGLALEDLYLGCACELARESGWQSLHESYATRLVGLAVRRGARGAEPDDVVSSFLARLALPPERGPRRTRIGMYAGAAALWSWLAVGLARRLMRESEQSARVSSEVAEDRATVPADGEPRLEQHEYAAQVDAALAEAWIALEPAQRTAVVWRHRDGLSQRRIATLLGVPEYQVSRWLSRALERLRTAVARRAPSPDDAADWQALGAMVARRLARADEPVPSDASLEMPRS